jgi:hypothetical protein
LEVREHQAQFQQNHGYFLIRSNIQIARALAEHDYEARYAEIKTQRERLAVRPAPLFSQQQQMLTSLVADWDEMNTDERKRVLAAVFESITASAEGVDRLEPARGVEALRPRGHP